MPNKEGGDLNVIESAGSIGQISQFTNSYAEKKDNSAMPPIYQPKPERDIISNYNFIEIKFMLFTS